MNLDEFWDRFNTDQRNFQGCIIQNINFDGIDFDSIDFRNSDLCGAKVRKTTFKNCDFSGANLSNCDIEQSSFTNSQLVGSNFTTCSATDLAFDRCNLSASKFIQSEMDGVYFYLSDLRKSQWQHSRWSGGFTECNLTQAQMTDMYAISVQILNTIYPNGVSGDLSWHDTLVKGNPPTPKTSTIIDPRDRVELKSAVGINYSTLRDLLSECRWDAAQDKTYEIIRKLVGEDGYYLKPESITEIPCTDLITIDLLWVEYSWGQFGLSVQKEIWMSIYRGDSSFNPKNHDIFCKQVWTGKIKALKKLKDEKSIKLVPAGYYPNILSIFLNFEEEVGLTSLYRRLSECGVAGLGYDLTIE